MTVLRAIATLFLLLCVLPAFAAEPAYPALSGRVVDGADQVLRHDAQGVAETDAHPNILPVSGRLLRPEPR